MKLFVFRLCLGGALTFTSLTGHAKELVRIAGDVWPPYVTDPASGKLGFTTDIVKQVFETEGYDVKFELKPFTRALEDCKAGRLDFVLVVYKEDAANNKLAVHNETLGMSQNKFYVKKADPWVYKGIDSLKSQKLGIIAGYGYGELDSYLQDPANKGKIEAMHGDSPLETNLKKLVKGRITATVDDELVVMASLAAEKMVGEVQEAGSLGSPNPVFAGVCPQTDPKRKEFAQILDKGIIKARSSGSLKAILANYGVKDWKK